MIKKLFEAKTDHHRIRIIEDYPIRKMLFGNGLCMEQSSINLLSPNEHVCDYSRLSLYTLNFISNPKNILIIGLGGAVLPNCFSSLFPEANIDILEIDPEVVSISKKYFKFQESDRMKVYIGDAYDTISKTENKYDIIISDVFTTNYIPFHIMSLDFYILAKLSMKEKSVMAINTCNDHPSFNSHLHTLFTEFGDNLYRADGPNNKLNSVIFAARECSDDNLKKIEINEDIMSAKIFSIHRFHPV